nr:D-isomer specific 2-hydroxyacid dehydrogenase family protein [Tanacetum cinerariifolium]
MRIAVRQKKVGEPTGDTLLGKIIVAPEDLVDEKGSHEDILEFAKKSDIVTGIIDKAFISAMKKGGLLVNIARGGLLNYEALHNGLISGQLGGLGIDVAWREPFDPDDPILNFPNVLLTPHVAGVTECSFRSMAKVCVYALNL